MTVETYPERRGLIARIKAILLTPKAAWRAIATEPFTAKQVFVGYVMILAAINPICFTIGRMVFGERVLGVAYRPPILAALIEAVFSYALILGAVWVLAVLIELLATPFGAMKDRRAAFKIAAYASTAGWLGSVFYLVPVIGVLALIGQIYTLYLLYRGVEILLRPQGRTIGYVALVVMCYVVLMMLVISLTKLLSALA